MFGLSFAEIAMVAVVAFLIFGPERTPEILKKVYVAVIMLRRKFADIRMEIMRHTSSVEREFNSLADDVWKKQLDPLASLQKLTAADEKKIYPADSFPKETADNIEQVTETPELPVKLPESSPPSSSESADHRQE